MKEEPDETNACGKTKVEPSKSSGCTKTTFEPEQISPGDMIVRKGISMYSKEELEWAKYIVIQKIVTTSRLKDEPRTSFKALLLSCHETNHAMSESVGCICYITPHQFNIHPMRGWWETVVESGLSWDDEKDRKNVINAEGR
tara:strand:+ start:943 stop:1368 length:426 start_codon:yes stop_codon:yes gene_type:complete